MRNPNPFTSRQIYLLQAIREKIRQINDPDSEVIRHDSYKWYVENLAGFGKIPKITFKPNSQYIKSEIMIEAGLTESISEDRKHKRASARTQHNVISKPKNDKQRLADLFDKEWNNIALKLKKAAFTAAFINQLFATLHQQISVPIQLLQGIIMDEYKSQIKTEEPIHDLSPARTESRYYEDELLEVEWNQ